MGKPSLVLAPDCAESALRGLTLYLVALILKCALLTAIVFAIEKPCFDRTAAMFNIFSRSSLDDLVANTRSALLLRGALLRLLDQILFSIPGKSVGTSFREVHIKTKSFATCKII